MQIHKKTLMGWLLLLPLATVFAQQPTVTPPSGTPAVMPGMRNAMANAKQEPKPYKEVITDKAVSHKGLFTVHKGEDKL
jgi:hypothetical protein